MTDVSSPETQSETERVSLKVLRTRLLTIEETLIDKSNVIADGLVHKYLSLSQQEERRSWHYGNPIIKSITGRSGDRYGATIVSGGVIANMMSDIPDSGGITLSKETRTKTIKIELRKDNEALSVQVEYSTNEPGSELKLLLVEFEGNIKGWSKPVHVGVETSTGVCRYQGDDIDSTVISHVNSILEFVTRDDKKH